MIMGVNVNKMILTNLTFSPPQSISFYGMLPDSISEAHQANFQQVDIKSRSNPLASYDSSAARTTTLTIDVSEDYLAEFTGGTADIRDYIAVIKSLTYPEYQGTVVVPPRVMLRIGNFFKIKGYCTNCEILWKRPIRNGRYIAATINISITEALSRAFAASEIFTKEDLRVI